MRNRIRCLAAAIVGIPVAFWWLAVYDNYHAVIPGVLYRAGQMSAKQLRRHAVRDNLKTVISLRPETNQPWHAKEVSECAAMNITHRDFPLAGDKAPTTRQMAALAQIMRTAQTPILIHCEHGADRTGLAIALYLRAIGGRSENEARRALSIRYGHLPFLGMHCFDEGFERYCLHLSQGPAAHKSASNDATAETGGDEGTRR